MRAVRTTCPYCGVGCGITASRTGERTVEIAGDKSHPANAGRLCSKGTHLAETTGLEGRLLYPMIGETRVDWAAESIQPSGFLRRQPTTAMELADVPGFVGWMRRDAPYATGHRVVSRTVHEGPWTEVTGDGTAH